MPLKPHKVIYDKLLKMNVRLLESYKGMIVKHEVECLICHHICKKRPTEILDEKHGCKNCYQLKLEGLHKDKFPIPYLPNKSLRHERSYIRRRSLILYCIYYKGGKCEKCGLDLIDNPILADFHHHTGDKTECISRMIKDVKEVEPILKEVDICTLLCSNCHRIEHGYGDRYEEFEDYIKNNALDYYNKGK